MTNRERLFNARSYEEWTESIVRCSDCIHGEINNSIKYPVWCKALGCVQSEDGFCDAGEEKDETD